MEVVRIGLSIRALRRRRHWTQQRLADVAGVSRPVIGRIETGRVDRVAVHTLERIAGALGATVRVTVLWHGEGLDRLLDVGHAALTEQTLRLLDTSGWIADTEVSFNQRGERGVVDILAFHEATGSLLVIEIKSVVPDLQAMLGGLDRKTRVAGDIAKQRGWQVRTVSRLLVLPDDRTSRRRIAQHRATFDSVLPERTAAVRRWIRRPVGRLGGVLFLTGALQAVTRHRVGSNASASQCPSRTNRQRRRPHS